MYRWYERPRRRVVRRAADDRDVIFAAAVRTDAGGQRSWDITSRANDVSLEKELIKAGEVSRDYALNVNIVKSFHRMWMASVKG